MLRSSRRSRGFTLVELIVALAVAALVVTLAHRIVVGIGDAAARLPETVEAHQRTANAHRLLTQLGANLDLGPQRSRGFTGPPHAVSFDGWVEDAAGAWTYRRVSISADGGRLAVSGATDRPLVLREGVVALEIEYLLHGGAADRWVRTWISEASAPVALRLRIATAEAVDTLLVVVGERG